MRALNKEPHGNLGLGLSPILTGGRFGNYLPGKSLDRTIQHDVSLIKFSAELPPTTDDNTRHIQSG